jgi:hypothetical protein
MLDRGRAWVGKWGGGVGENGDFLRGVAVVKFGGVVGARSFQLRQKVWYFDRS